MKKLISVLCLASLVPVYAFAGEEQKGQYDMRIAITFDDLPVHNDLPVGITRQQVGKDIITALKAAGVAEVYGFVNAASIEQDPSLAEVLSDWRAAGYPLGNHTWSHPNLNDLSVTAYTEEIVKNETVLKKYSKGMDWHWLRYPFLSEGSDPEKRKAIRDLLAKRGYRIAQVTMSFGDYMWNGPYARCATKQDAQSTKMLEYSYLKAAADALEQSHGMSNALYQRDIPYVLLMHVGAFDAYMLPKLLAMYKSKGVKLISLEQAQSDSFYASDSDPSLLAEPPGLEQRMLARGLTVPGVDPLLTAILDSICK
jgi:peptidoglycan-N-acetylglucosamine deacetylase